MVQGGTVNTDGCPSLPSVFGHGSGQLIRSLKQRLYRLLGKAGIDQHLYVVFCGGCGGLLRPVFHLASAYDAIDAWLNLQNASLRYHEARAKIQALLGLPLRSNVLGAEIPMQGTRPKDSCTRRQRSDWGGRLGYRLSGRGPCNPPGRKKAGPTVVLPLVTPGCFEYGSFRPLSFDIIRYFLQIQYPGK